MDRPRRTIKKPVTYWEEYVQTDVWYAAALVEDIPADEMHAACVDDDYSCSESGDDATCSETSDSEYASQLSSDSTDNEDEDGEASESEEAVQRPAKGE
jgi:hypothetical protein